jgi:hypothetical protein
LRLARAAGALRRTPGYLGTGEADRWNVRKG